MADNVRIDEGTGVSIASDEIDGVKHQRVKIQHGVDGSATDVSSASPLPVTDSAMAGYVDGLEGLATQIRDYVDTLETNTDSLEAYTDQLEGYVDQLEGYVDGLETLITSTNTKLDAGNVSTASIDTKTPALGQALAAGSTPVVLTAAQLSAITPPAAITGFATSAKQDTLLTELQLKADLTETQPVSAASLPLPSGAATSANQQTDALTNTQLRATPVPVSGTVTATPTGTQNVDVTANTIGLATGAKQDTGNTSVASIDTKTPALGQALAAASVPIVLTAAQISTLTPLSTVAATQSGSWSVTANAGTNLNTSALALESGGNLASVKTNTDKIPSLGQALAAASVPVVLTAAQITTLTPPAAITGFATESTLSTLNGKVTAVDTGAVVISSSALPSGASTAAKQPALGTAGTSSADVITVQGRAAMTPILTDGSATTQPISGTVTANAGTNLNTSALALESGGNLASVKTNTDKIPSLGQALAAASVPVVLTAAQISTLTPLSTVAATQSGTWNVTNVSGTVSLPTGASTLAEQQTQTTSLSVLDDWDESDRAKVNPIVGSAGVAGAAGTVGATTQRVVKGTGTTSTQTQVADSASSGTILAANTSRIRATIVNDSTQILYLRESSSAATTAVYTYKLQPNMTAIIDDYNGALTGIWAANASGNAVISEVVA